MAFFTTASHGTPEAGAKTGPSSLPGQTRCLRADAEDLSPVEATGKPAATGQLADAPSLLDSEAGTPVTRLSARPFSPRPTMLTEP
jgi:hypothetical protein